MVVEHIVYVRIDYCDVRIIIRAYRGKKKRKQRERGTERERETIARAFIHVYYTNLYIPRGSFFLSPSRPHTIDSRGGDGSLLLFFIYIYMMCVCARKCV